jgi:site-specific recombinase XerD
MNEALNEAKQKNGTELVFPRYARNDREIENVKAMGDIKRAFNTAEAKIADIYPAFAKETFHNLRGASAMTLCNNNGPFAAIQAMFNHKNPKTEMIYIQGMEESLKAASDILDKKLGDTIRNWGTGGALEAHQESTATH